MTAGTNWLSLKIDMLLSKKGINFHIMWSLSCLVQLAQIYCLHLSGRPYEKNGNFSGGGNVQKDSSPKYEPLKKVEEY